MVKGQSLPHRSGTSLAAANRRGGLGIITNRCRVRSIDFPAALIPAATFKPVLNNCGMSKLPGHPVRALNQLVIKNQATADPLRYCDGHQVAHTLGVLPEPYLSKRTRVSGVLHLYGQPCHFFYGRFQVEIAPSKV